MRVLLVDDEAQFARTLAERLELRGVSVMVAHDGETALRMLEDTPPASRASVELAFLDVHLPGMDGVTLLRTLRERFPDMDVVMLSGSTAMDTAVRAMRRGAVNWLPKPVEVDALLEECRRCAERRHKRILEMRQADAAMLRSLGRVAEGVAHEVNNPVNIMMQAAGWIGDLLEELEQSPDADHAPQLTEIRDALARIRHQSLRVREITRRLLMYGKGMDTGTAAVDIREALDKAADMLAGRATLADVAVQVDIPGDMPRPLGSAVELHQICVHIMENALDAMPHGGELYIRGMVQQTADYGMCCTLDFIDTGPGIAEDALPLLFEPFFTTRARGAGLGLAVCRSLAQRHGWRLLASDTVQGTCFTLYMPLGEEAHGA